MICFLFADVALCLRLCQRKQPEASGGGGAAGKPAKKVSKEEAEALARREAARARTEKRTMKQFGLI
jgi:WW domain-binding protein 4